MSSKSVSTIGLSSLSRRPSYEAGMPFVKAEPDTVSDWSSSGPSRRSPESSRVPAPSTRPASPARTSSDWDFSVERDGASLRRSVSHMPFVGPSGLVAAGQSSRSSSGTMRRTPSLRDLSALPHTTMGPPDSFGQTDRYAYTSSAKIRGYNAGPFEPQRYESQSLPAATADPYGLRQSLHPPSILARRGSGPTLPSLRNALAAPQHDLAPVLLEPRPLPSIRALKPEPSSPRLPQYEPVYPASAVQPSAGPSTQAAPAQIGFTFREMQQDQDVIYESGPPYSCEFWSVYLSVSMRRLLTVVL